MVSRSSITNAWERRVLLGALSLWCCFSPPLRSHEVETEPCTDWVVLEMNRSILTWMDYQYWFAIRFGWDPEAALHDYQKDGRRWQTFVYEQAAYLAIQDMGITPPSLQEIEQTVLSVASHLPDPFPEAILKRVIAKVLTIQKYRDETFRYALTIDLNQLHQEFEKRRVQEPDLEFNAIYETLANEIVERELPEKFFTWEKEQLKRFPWHKVLPPEACESTETRKSLRKIH